MNKVILTGRLTKDPESRATMSNGEVARFSLACQGNFTNKNGEREVEFINCVAFGTTAGVINKYCRKGTLISVTGRIRNSSYDAKDGTKRYSTDVVCEQMEFLGTKQGGSEYSQNNNSYEQPSMPEQSNVETTDITEDPYKDFGEEITLTSDDLPF